MRTMVVHPHEGVDRIRFGMDRAAVARAVGITPKRFKRSAFGLEEDSFEALGVFVSYDEHGLCNAISVSRGLGTDWEYEGYRLLAHPARAVRAWALTRDPQLDAKDGFTSKVLGLGMCADWIDESDLSSSELAEPGASFIVFRPGYHEQEHARMVAAGLVPA